MMKGIVPPPKKIRTALLERNNRALTRALEDLQLETSRLQRQITDLERQLWEACQEHTQPQDTPIGGEDIQKTLAIQTEEEVASALIIVHPPPESKRTHRKTQRVTYAEPSLKKKMRRS